MKEKMLQKIADREYVVGIVGLGYVGLPLALEFDVKGFRVIGFDIDEQKVELLSQGKSYIQHIGTERVTKMVNSGRFTATTDFARAGEADALILCVPTPLTKQREPDMTYIVDTINALAPSLRAEHFVCLESTTYPGTTAEIIVPTIEQQGFKVGRDAFVAFSPEREDPGNKNFQTGTIPKVVGADDEISRAIATALYSAIIVKVVPVSSTRAAEAVKLTENIFRSVNIALVNELKLVYDQMGIDIWEVIEGAKSKPFGFMPFYPGPGLGGHCIPIDPFYLTWKAREFEVPTKFIELAGEINTAMPHHVVQKTQDALNAQGKSIKGSSVLVLGIAYKKDVDDMRESPSLRIIDLLRAKGAKVEFYDPYIPVILMTREFSHLAAEKTIQLTAAEIRRFDAVVIATDHSNVDYKALVEQAKLVIDTRNACQGIASTKVVKA